VLLFPYVFHLRFVNILWFFTRSAAANYVRDRSKQVLLMLRARACKYKAKQFCRGRES
jgi:hypothetical protein